MSSGRLLLVGLGLIVIVVGACLRWAMLVEDPGAVPSSSPIVPPPPVESPVIDPAAVRLAPRPAAASASITPARLAELRALKAKVYAAATHLAQHREVGLREFSDRHNRWGQEPYIFTWNLQGVCLAHPNNPVLIGRSLIGMTDVKGHNFAIDFARIAADDAAGNQGWSEYWWNKMGDDQPFRKVSFIMRVPGTDWLVGAGIYCEDLGLADISRALAD